MNTVNPPTHAGSMWRRQMTVLHELPVWQRRLRSEDEAEEDGEALQEDGGGEDEEGSDRNMTTMRFTQVSSQF